MDYIVADVATIKQTILNPPDDETVYRFKCSAEDFKEILELDERRYEGKCWLFESSTCNLYLLVGRSFRRGQFSAKEYMLGTSTMLFDH